MADELLFDSERQEKKTQRRKWLFPALALAAVLLIAVAVALILRGKNKTEIHKLGEDSLYPFTWQLNADGSILLELPHENAPAYRWVLTNGETLSALDAVREEKESNNTTRFTLTAREEGRNLLELSLRLQSEEAPAEPSDGEKVPEQLREADSLYQLTLLTEFIREDGKLKGTILNYSGLRRQTELTGGAGSANPYRIYARDGKRLTVAVKISPVETDWSCEILSGQDSVTEEGVIYQSGEVLLQLRAGLAPGESELVFSSEAAAAELRLRLTYAPEGALLVTEHSAQYGEKTVVLPSGTPEETGSEGEEPQPAVGEASATGPADGDPGEAAQTEPESGTEPETEAAP